MSKRSFLWLFIPVVLQAAEPAALPDVLGEAEARNPELAGARAAALAAEARVGPARTWPNPMLRHSREKLPDGEKMSRWGAEQEIPFPGKLSAEGRMARHEAHGARARAEAKALEVRGRARALYHQLYRADRLIGFLEENIAVTKSLVRSMESRLAAGGMGGGGDVFTMQAELGRMEAMLFEETKTRDIRRVELNALLDRPVTGAIGATRAPVLADLPFSLEEALRRAEARAPLLAAARAEEGHAGAMSARARREFLPDVSVMYERIAAEGGMTGSEAGVGLSVPLWWGRPAGFRREARAHAAEAAALSRAMANDVRKMTAMEYHETEMHLGMARRYRDQVVPAAEAAWRLSRRRYESAGSGMGAGDFARILQALQTLIAAQTEYHNQLYHFGEHWGYLEQWIGEEIKEKSHEK
jgi:outer membrane protein, heavy metal efflux system